MFVLTAETWSGAPLAPPDNDKPRADRGGLHDRDRGAQRDTDSARPRAGVRRGAKLARQRTAAPDGDQPRFDGDGPERPPFDGDGSERPPFDATDAPGDWWDGEHGDLGSGSPGMRPVQGEFFGLGDLPGGPHASSAFAISGDGRTIVGWSRTDAADDAFIWRRGPGIRPLAAPPGGGRTLVAHTVSDNGDRVLGTVRFGAADYPFVWTAETGVVVRIPGQDGSHGSGGPGFDGRDPDHFLPQAIPQGFREGPFFNDPYRYRIGRGATPDGSIVVGDAFTSWGQEAILWTPRRGAMSLNQLAACQAGIDLRGWSLTSAADISHDGRVVVGVGINAEGQSEAFYLDIGTVLDPDSCPADWNSDGIVNAADLGAFSSSYMRDLAYGTRFADFNHDCDVNPADFGEFITEYLRSIGECLD